MTSKPAWLISQLRDRHMCQQCASRTAATEWAGTGKLLCWPCCEKRQAAHSLERLAAQGHSPADHIDPSEVQS
jgi:hypothetical protein